MESGLRTSAPPGLGQRQPAQGIVQDGQRRFQIYTNDTGLQASIYAPIVVAYRNGSAVRLSDIARSSTA